MPLLALTITPVQAAAIMLPILCAMDLVALRAYRGKWDRANVVRLLPGAMVGIAIGTLTFRYLNADAIRLLLGLITLAFAVQHWLSTPRETARLPNRAMAGLLGTVSGFTSFVAHAGAAPVQIALLPQRLDKTIYVGTMAFYFAAINYAKLIPYGWLGQLDPTNLATAVVLFPLVPVGMYLGLRLHGRIRQDLFYRIVYMALFAAGAKLTFDGVSGLLAG